MNAGPSIGLVSCVRQDSHTGLNHTLNPGTTHVLTNRVTAPETPPPIG